MQSYENAERLLANPGRFPAHYGTNALESMNLDSLDSIGHQSRKAKLPAEAVSATRLDSLAVHSPCRSGGAAPSQPSAPGTRESTQNGVGNEHLDLLKAIAASKLFTEFERAFTRATGLPVALRAAESFQLSFQECSNRGPFCALMARENRTCGVCLQSQSQVAQAAMEKPHTKVCYAGLCETAVPLRLGNRLVGFLWTGQAFLRKPSKMQFRRTFNLLANWGTDLDKEALREAYFKTRVVSQEQHAAAVMLLTIFAEHLAILSNQILIQRENTEPPMITRAKNFIREHHTEDLSLSQVAQFVHASSFYFCKLFSRTTGLTFTNFLSRVRVENSKRLLINPQLRISEVAFEVGFQSLANFNRVFLRIVGQSPSEYRLKVQGEKKSVLFTTHHAR